MNIVFIIKWHSDNMGYINNCLPREIAKLGHKVHLITSTAQIDFDKPHYETSFKKYLGPPVVEEGRYYDGEVQIIRLNFVKIKNKIALIGLAKSIFEIKPDIIHTFEHVGIDTLKMLALKSILKFKLFTSNHQILALYRFNSENKKLSFSIFFYWFFTEYLLGKIISAGINCCFAVSQDAGIVATKYQGLSPKKLKVATLGTDTGVFYPDEELKNIWRKKFNYDENDMVILYSGKFTERKRIFDIIEAVLTLNNKGLRFKILLVGSGELEEKISSYDFIKIISFTKYSELGHIYRMADFAVWPGEESSSQIDAVAVGLNLVLTDKIIAYAKVNSSNATETRPKIVTEFFKHGSPKDLAETLERMINSYDLKSHSDIALKTINEVLSWKIIAKNRISDYESH